jgi:hypothetical protein
MGFEDEAEQSCDRPCRQTNGRSKRWSHFLTQPAKVGSPMQRTTHHEDAETVFG